MERSLRHRIDHNIWRLVWPNVISNITTPLLGMADVAIAGRVGGDATIGAVAVGSTVFNFIYWNCAFMRMGTSGVAAQAFGSNQLTDCSRTLVRGSFIAMMLGLLLLTLRMPIVSLAEYIIDSPATVAPEARTYIEARFFAVPAAVMIFVIHGWFIGMQDSRSPMLISLVANVVNVAASAWLALFQGWGVAGIAWGTVIAQYTSLTLSVIVWHTKYSHHIPLASLRESMSKASLRRFFSINTDIFLRTFCVTITYTAFSVVSARMGETQLAVNSLLMQLLMIFSFFSDGVAYAAESLSGRFVGARDWQMLRLTINRLMVWAGAACAIYTVGYILGWRQILSFFDPSETVLGCAEHYVGWVAVLPLVAFAPFLIDGILFGATLTRPMRNTTFVAMLGFFAILPLTVFFESHALWLAFLIFFALRGILILPTLRRLYNS